MIQPTDFREWKVIFLYKENMASADFQTLTEKVKMVKKESDLIQKNSLEILFEKPVSTFKEGWYISMLLANQKSYNYIKSKENDLLSYGYQIEKLLYHCAGYYINI